MSDKTYEPTAEDFSRDLLSDLEFLQDYAAAFSKGRASAHDGVAASRLGMVALRRAISAEAMNAKLRGLLGEVMSRYNRGVECREYCGDENGGELNNTVLGIAVDLEDLTREISEVVD